MVSCSLKGQILKYVGYYVHVSYDTSALVVRCGGYRCHECMKWRTSVVLLIFLLMNLILLSIFPNDNQWSTDSATGYLCWVDCAIPLGFVLSKSWTPARSSSLAAGALVFQRRCYAPALLRINSLCWGETPPICIRTTFSPEWSFKFGNQ